MAWFSWLSKTRRFESAAQRYWPHVKEIDALSGEMRGLTDAALKERIARKRGQSLADLTAARAEIFAAVREASERVLHMRHFDVQLLGGLTLLEGSIAEMKTGEGKTLVATLPLILRGLTGQGAHLVTVNDYLATRDAQWMLPLYDFFSLTVGVVTPGMSPAQKREAYASDITYATNNELGFDYLRDNMAQTAAEMTQRNLTYAIVDEVDSILIDEARTPLIISAPDAESTHLYGRFAALVPQLKEGEHYNVDEKRRAVTLTDEGTAKVEELLGIDNIYQEHGVRTVHHLEQALRARTLYRRDKDYVVKDGAVIIVDEFTGRLMEGRRYAEGLHQAIEAAEGVRVQQESRTLATITFQNLFRLYDTLAGMTGTAVTSAEEFEKVYNTDVIVVPTAKQMIRRDKPDRIFVNEGAKFTATVAEITTRHQAGQPVLVGTIAIEKSERLSALLAREGVPHEVLNAKNHAREAEIIAKAGQRGAVTISTNMAGRGTDIKLGEGVPNVGGLFVLGTERHEARRIDNQLRGRSGRQGDPGETQFFVSLEDDVMRIFGGERIRTIMRRLNVPENEPIENRLINRALEGAQARVEGYYFDMRSRVLSYDDVLNRQRTAVYALRRSVLIDGTWREAKGDSIDLDQRVALALAEQAHQLVAVHTSDDSMEAWNSEEIAENVAALTGAALAEVHGQLQEIVTTMTPEGPAAARAELEKKTAQILADQLAAKKQSLPPATWQQLLSGAAIRAIDTHWMEHLDTMDYLRTGIGLRGYGQRDPLVEYQKESYQLFQRLMATIESSFVDTVFRARLAAQPTTTRPQENIRLTGGQEGSALNQLAQQQPVAAGGPARPVTADQPLKNAYKNVSRNDACPCGSGKKFKKCHGISRA